MTEIQDREFSLSYQVAGVVALWVAAVVLQVTGATLDHYWLGNWAIMLAGAAAAWTAVIGVKRVMTRCVRRLVVVLGEQLDDRLASAVTECADTLVRRLEVRDLQQQVAQLVPHQRT